MTPRTIVAMANHRGNVAVRRPPNPSPRNAATKPTRAGSHPIITICPTAKGTTIAHDLMISLKTVHNHVSNVFTKLQVSERAQAIVKAREAGLGGN
jgi:hypothetical protein